MKEIQNKNANYSEIKSNNHLLNDHSLLGEITNTKYRALGRKRQ